MKVGDKVRYISSYYEMVRFPSKIGVIVDIQEGYLHPVEVSMGDTIYPCNFDELELVENPLDILKAFHDACDQDGMWVGSSFIDFDKLYEAYNSARDYLERNG